MTTGRGNKIHAQPHTWAWPAFVLSMLIITARKWESLAWPRLYAEDGPVFLTGAFARGIWSIFEPYAGYLHAIPRVGALVSAQLPVAGIPAASAWFSFFITAATFAVILWKPSPVRFRGVVLILIALLPNTGEVFFNLTNTIWFSGLLLFFLLISDDPVSRRGRLADYSALFLCSVSGIYSVLLAPFFLARTIIAPRTRYRLVSAAIVLSGAVTQLVVFKLTSPPSTDVTMGPAVEWLPVLAKRTIGQTFLQPGWLGAGHGGVAVSLIFAVLLCFVLVYGWRKNNWTIVAGLGFLALLLAATAIRIRVPALLEGNNGDRYFFLPGIILILVVIQIFTHSTTFSARACAGTLLAMAVINGTQRFWMERYPLRQWSEDSKCFGDDRPCNIEIIPDGWGFQYDPAWPYLRSWHKSRTSGS